MNRFSDQEIATIHSKLSSPQFNALRLKLAVEEPVEQLSLGYIAEGEGGQSAKLEPNPKRDSRNR